MATQKDFETINAIQAARSKAKKQHKDVAITLSGGNDYYRKAISSVRNAGLCNFIVSVCTMIFMATVSVVSLVQANFSNTALDTVLNTWVLYAVFLYTGFVGHKISRLDATPTFAIINLIISAAIEVLLIVLQGAATIAGLLSIIFTIFALIHWSAYKEWFTRFKR